MAADGGAIRGSAWRSQWPGVHTDTGGSIPMDTYVVVQVTQERNITKYYVNGTYSHETWGAHEPDWNFHHSELSFAGDVGGANGSTMIYEAPVTGLAPISPAEAAALLAATQAVLPSTVGPTALLTNACGLRDRVAVPGTSLIGWAPAPGPGPYASQTWQLAASTRPNDSLPGEVFSLPGQTCFPSTVNVVGVGPRTVGTPPLGRKIEMPHCPQSKMTFNNTGPVLNGVGTVWSATSWDPNSYELKYVKTAGTSWAGSTWSATYNNFTWPPFTCAGAPLSGYESDVVVSSAYWGERYTFHVTHNSVAGVGDPLNPGGRVPCYWVPNMTVPVSRCPEMTISTATLDGTLGASNLDVTVPGTASGNSALFVLKVPQSGQWNGLFDSGRCLVTDCFFLALRNDGSSLSFQYVRWDLGQPSETHSFSTTQGFGSSGYVVLQIPLPLWNQPLNTVNGGDNRVAVNGVEVPINGGSNAAWTWGYPFPPSKWDPTHYRLWGHVSGAPDARIKYSGLAAGTALLTPTQSAALLAAALTNAPTATTTTLPSGSTTTSPPTTTTTAVPVPASALNPDGRAPCYYLPGMTLPVARCSGIYTYGFQNGPVAGAGLGVPGSIAGNSYLAVIRLPESGSSSDNHLVAQLGGCANGQSGQLLAVKNFGGQIQTTRTDCINGYYSYHAVNSVLGFGSSTEYKVLQVTLPQGSGVSNKIYVDGVDMGISYESIPGLAFDCCYPGPYGETALSLSPGPPNFGQNINSLKYVTILQGTAPLSPAQAAALLAAVMPPSTTTTTTTAVVSSTTTTPSGPLSGALTASIVRGTNNAAGASVYSVTLKVTGATSGGSYEFVVPSGHVPDPVPSDRVTHRYLKTAVAGEVVWEYSLVAPRGVYRAEVYSAGGSTPISTVEVK
jgi:hypothetical protein